MKHCFGKKFGISALSALLCVPLALSVLTACGGGEENPEEETGVWEQSVAQDSDALAFVSLAEAEITDDYAVNALDKEIDYLLMLDEDRLLYWFYKNASLTPVAFSGYGGGWESALIGGHTLGHYLSALGQAYANAGVSSSERKQVMDKISYIVGELKLCQDNAVNAGSKEGFLWGASTINNSNYEIQFDNVEKGLANIVSQAWVPWYTMHKIIAGLIDVWVYTGLDTAYEVVTALGDWVYNRVTQWDAATQARVLSIEYGGMNDCMYNLYAMTGDERYAVAAHMFDEESLFDKVFAAKANYLDGLHANTTIPKILGALNRYVACDGKTIAGETVDARDMLDVAELFWEYVVEHHTYVTGGNSEWEHFGKDDILDAERTNANCETCNTYNMLKLSRTLFTITKDTKYLDYYENTYYNAIWSSQNPETGMTTYFQPMATGYFKVYSTAEESFWCCTGSGMESMTKLNDSIYYTAGNATYVAMYLQSTYKTDSVSLTQTADLENSNTARIKIDSGSTVLRLRRPSWTASFAVYVNNREVEMTGDESFVSVDVKSGDEVRVELEKTVTAYNLPDGENTYAFKYGPYVLSAELGTEDMNTTTTGVNVTVPQTAIGDSEYSVPSTDVADFMANINSYMTVNGDGTFTLACNNGTLTYSYHFRQYTQRYGLYFKFVVGEVQQTEDAWTWTTEDTRQPGYGQYETDLVDNGTTGGASSIGDVERYATAGGSFTYSAMKVNADRENRLLFYLAKADDGKTLKVTVDGTTVYEETLAYSGESAIYSVSVAIPAAAAEDGTVSVTFSGINGAQSARILNFVYTQSRSFNANVQDPSIAYFVDCGDYDVYTVSAGDKLGVYNSVTEQVYGADPITGKMWGIVDNQANDIAGTAEYGIGTNSTWAYEYSTPDGSDKTVTNRYTKNQVESNVARNLHYKFELEDGTYVVKMYFADPWNVSANPNVSANGTSKITNGAIGQELSFNITVTNGELVLDITSDSLCINLCYIVILFT